MNPIKIDVAYACPDCGELYEDQDAAIECCTRADEYEDCYQCAYCWTIYDDLETAENCCKKKAKP